jgi:pyruvate-formate lyase
MTTIVNTLKYLMLHAVSRMGALAQPPVQCRVSQPEEDISEADIIDGKSARR